MASALIFTSLAFVTVTLHMNRRVLAHLPRCPGPPQPSQHSPSCHSRCCTPSHTPPRGAPAVPQTRTRRFAGHNARRRGCRSCALGYLMPGPCPAHRRHHPQQAETGRQGGPGLCQRPWASSCSDQGVVATAGPLPRQSSGRASRPSRQGWLCPGLCAVTRQAAAVNPHHKPLWCASEPKARDVKQITQRHTALLSLQYAPPETLLLSSRCATYSSAGGQYEAQHKLTPWCTATCTQGTSVCVQIPAQTHGSGRHTGKAVPAFTSVHA